MPAWLLLLLLAAGVRCGQGDSLPLSLVEMVRNGPISSLEDLPLLLFSDFVGEPANSQSGKSQSSNDTVHRTPRSLGAQPAQQALCKVRTEVLEVTRAMLDRSNANFLLWPPCVEVQRCSGCCNTASMQCVPVATHTRHLQVMKIQFVNKHPRYEKAVISIQDHVECRCQAAAPHLSPRPGQKKSALPRKHNPGEPKPKGRSKEELHRRDELKPNQWSLAAQTETLHTNVWERRTEATPLWDPTRGHQPVKDVSIPTALGERGFSSAEGEPDPGRQGSQTELPKWVGNASYANVVGERRGKVDQSSPRPPWTPGPKSEGNHLNEQLSHNHLQPLHPHHHHLHPPQQPTTQSTATAPPPRLRPPAAPPVRRTPAHHRKIRKNRHKISKSAMRAILM